MNRVRSCPWVAGIAAGLLLLSTAAEAGFLSTRRALANFHFSADAITYDVGTTVLTLADDSSGSVISVGGAGGINSEDPTDPLRGSLYLEEHQRGAGRIKRASISLFGSIPSAASVSEVQRLEEGISAVDVDMRDDVLAFLADQRPTAGPLVGKMQSAGIFLMVPGVALPVWINGYKDGAPAQQLLALEDAVEEGTVSPDALPMPLPGTLGLVISLLPFVSLVRRRRTH